jgi:murein DD-endopeptidase MepM/ murein hydrolase activator NlpD
MNLVFRMTMRLRAGLLPLREAVERHPRRLAAGVGSVLLLSSATAFGLAEFGPQPQLPPTTTLQQPLALDLAPQLQALDGDAQLAYTTTDVRGADTAESLLHRLQVTDPAQLRALAHDAALRQLLGATRQLVNAQVNGLGQLVRLQAALPQGRGDEDATWLQLDIAVRPDGTLDSQITTQTAEPQVRVANGVVQSSLFAATDAAGLPDALAAQMVNLFSGELDFRRDVHPGDSFAVVYRVYVANGQTLRVGRILAARMNTRGGEHGAVWFSPPGHAQDAAYYNLKGGSLARAFLLSPLPYDRMTSGYGWRTSPIFHKPEFHLGIDLAIPVGTPVRSIADGRVSYVGPGTGYGKYVRVEHPGGFATIYSHLSRFEARVGQRVRQGDVVALSGNSGWSTGPHLYFQFFVNGKPVNPSEIARYSPKGTPLPAALRETFHAQVAQPLHMLALLPGAAPAQAGAAPLRNGPGEG